VQINGDLIAFGLIHLSDIHFSSDHDFISKKYSSFFNALKDDFLGCSQIFVVVSGDIANEGLKSEYEQATNFFKQLSEDLKGRYRSVKLKFILVPGNHDCDFSLPVKSGKKEARRIDYSTIGVGSSYIDSRINLQKNFWDFYSIYSEVPKNKIFYRIIEEINNKKICFHCFNTAWMSDINETPGHLFFPVKSVPELADQVNYDINIAVFHHPTNWLNPNTQENNKREFQNLLDNISSLQIVGHEHKNEIRQAEDLDKFDSKNISFAGDIFQDLENRQESGFQTIIITPSHNKLKLIRYRWNKTKTLYQQCPQKEIFLEKTSKKALKLQESFVSKINGLNLPLSSDYKEVLLSDLYVYPHLEHIKQESSKRMEDYIDSSKLLDMLKEGIHVMEGETQIGKTSLLNKLTLDLYEKGFYPILLDGSKILNDNYEKILREAFRVQYVTEDDSYDRYKQLPKKNKVLLIDDFHACQLRKTNRNELIKYFEDLFGFIFMTIDSIYGMLSQCQISFKNNHLYSIKQLGYSKRNLLVEKYIKYKYSDNPDTSELADKIKITFDKLCQILGNKLIPSYPVFVLTIIQALDYTPLDINETSYGYCYQTLIHLALSKAGVIKDHIDAYINFITELAFDIFCKKAKSISEREFKDFHVKYCKKYWAPDYAIMNDKLIRSKILKSEYGEYQFSYIYVLYFLAAKRIAEMIDNAKGREIIKSLFENLHIEKNANILVFVTHHTKNYEFIQESIYTAMTPFNEIEPITLEKKSKYYTLLEDIVGEIKNDVIEMRDPVQERNRRLVEQDEIEREADDADDEDSKSDEIENNIQIRPFLHAIRSIEIIGQIVKNRKGSLDKATLKDMINELYNTGFRMVGALGDLIKQGKEDVAEAIQEKVKAKDTSYDIEVRVYRFLHFISLQACLGIFSKLVQCVGVRELQDLFNDVASEIDSPAAHLVSFSINSYYGTINMKELERLSKEFADNFVAFQILRSRVKAYIYNNHVDYKLKQRIGAYLKMNVTPQIANQ